MTFLGGRYWEQNFLSSLSDLLASFQDLNGAFKKAGDGVLILQCSDGMRGNVLKLKEVRLRLVIGKKLLTVRVVRH